MYSHLLGDSSLVGLKDSGMTEHLLLTDLTISSVCRYKGKETFNALVSNAF